MEKDYEPFKSVVREWHKTKGPEITFTEEDVKNFAKNRFETFLKNFSHLEDKIDLLLIDRYFYTSAVYQRNSGLNSREILQTNIDYGAPIPDLTFLFDCDPKICFERTNKRNQITGGKHLFSTSSEKIEEIRKQYLKLVNGRKEIKLIDANKPILEITPILITEINYLIQNATPT